MLRASLLTLSVLAGLTAAIVPSAGALPGHDLGKRGGPPASVRVAECKPGPAAGERLAVFRGGMRRMEGTERMSMRFRLQERVGDGVFRTVKAPGVGVWRKSQPNVRRFVHRQRVLALAEGSSYRTVVFFRWYGKNGQIIHRTTRRSRPCTQPGLLANLRVRRIGGGSPLAGVPGTYRYAVYLLNDGQVPAERFGIGLSVDDGAVDTQAVSSVAPGETRRLFFSGPPCQDSVRAVADPGDSVREVLEKDNSLTWPCPRGP